MGLKCAPDFAQQAMENMLQGINDSEVYLDDIGCFSHEWKHHLKLLDQVLTALQANGFTIFQGNAKGTFKKLIGLATGLPLRVLRIGTKKLTQYYIWIDPEFLSRCKVS